MGEDRQAGRSAPRRSRRRPTACGKTGTPGKARLATQSCRPQVARSPAAASGCRRGPPGPRLPRAAQQEPPESHGLLDDPGRRPHRLFPRAPARSAFAGRRPRPPRRPPAASTPAPPAAPAKRPRPPPRCSAAETRGPCRGPGGGPTPRSGRPSPGRPPARSGASRTSRWHSGEPAVPAPFAGAAAPTPRPARPPGTRSPEPAPPPPGRNAPNRPPGPSRGCLEEADAVGRDRVRQASASRMLGRWRNAHCRKSMSKSDRLLERIGGRVAAGAS